MKEKQKIPIFFTALLPVIVFLLASFSPSLSFFTNSANNFSESTETSYTQTPNNPQATFTPAPPFKADTVYRSYTFHSWDIPEEISEGNDFWLEVDLANQVLYAYHRNQLIVGFLVSTGTKSHQTVTGTYKIYAKYPSSTMAGPGYYLEDVPFALFFHKGYSIHGTYWHSNFGRPMSHGCINMKTSDAAWVYENAPVGTYVYIHY